jgi:hypothetical protein
MSNQDRGPVPGNQESVVPLEVRPAIGAKQLPPEAVAYDAVYRFLCDPYIQQANFSPFMPEGEVFTDLLSKSSEPILKDAILASPHPGFGPTITIKPYLDDGSMPGKALAWECVDTYPHSPSDVMRLLVVEAGKRDFYRSNYGLAGLYVARDRRVNELLPFFY